MIGSSGIRNIFRREGRSYEVGEVYYPSGDSQLAWIRWTTPEQPQTMTMTVRVRGGGGISKELFTSRLWIWMKITARSQCG